jgi:hypothetical protein
MSVPGRSGSINPRTGRRNRIAATFTPIPTEVMESPSWRALSLSARRVLDRLCIEPRHHAGRESTKLCVTYKEFTPSGSSRSDRFPCYATQPRQRRCR